MKESIRVLLADDHPATRSRIRAAVERDARFTVVAEVGDSPAAVAAALRERPDICLLDIRMSGSGIAATREITARLPGAKVVIITASLDDDDLFNALRAGAAGYLLKGMDPVRLPHALKDVLEGGSAIPRPLVARLVAEFRDHGPRRRVVHEAGHDLTSREWQVLELLRQGRSTAQIAERLFVSPATVRSHVAAVMRKLGVSDREDLQNLR